MSTENCPESNWYGFNNGLHCCRTYASALYPNNETVLTHAFDATSGHCLPEDMIDCPSLPQKICRIQSPSEYRG